MLRTLSRSSSEYAQHGPASLIGPPYVYTYQHSDKPGQAQDPLVSLIKLAASTPIDRYIPDVMTWDAVKRDVDDFLLFDWKAHAERIEQQHRIEAKPIVRPDRMDVIGRCFEIGRCKPLGKQE